MSPNDIKAISLEELSNIAPELEPAAIPTDADLRDEVDLDSLDFLNWITAIHKRLFVDVPEVDYQKLSTIESAVEYVTGKLS